MVAYVHIEYSTYQFSEESKEGGWNPTPPRPEKSVVLRGLNQHLIGMFGRKKEVNPWKCTQKSEKNGKG